MPVYWLDVEDADGVRLGDGPITSLLSWDFASRLDQAGPFSFAMPRDDPRASLLTVLGTVRCWCWDNGLRHLGAGRILRMETTLGADGAALLNVTGENELGQLRDRIILLDTFDEDVEIHPTTVWRDAVVLWETFDGAIGDTATSNTYDESSLAALYIYSPVKFDRITFHIWSGQSSNDSGHIYYTISSGWCSTDTANSFTPRVTNTTIASGTAWFGQSGYLEWDLEDLSDWALTDVGPGSGPDTINYGIKIIPPPGGWTAFVIQDIHLHTIEPTNDALNKIMAYAPPGWRLDAAQGYTTTQGQPLSAVELVANGGFETAGAGGADVVASWTEQINGSAAIAVSATAHGGSASIKLTNNGASSSTFSKVYQSFPCDPATECTLSFWTQGDGSHCGQWRLADPDITGNGGADGYIVGPSDTLVTAATWTQITKVFRTPAYTTNLRLDLLSPTAGSGAFALFDDVSVRMGGGKSISLDSAGESVQENLGRVVDTTGEHYILSTSPKQVLWLGTDVRDSGLRCVSHVDPLAVEDDADIALIESLTVVSEGGELFSRAYPFGGGAEPAPTLRNTTRQAPAGWVLNKEANYLERSESVAAYGVIEKRLDCDDITNVSGDTDGDVHGSNMVFDRTYQWLRRHSATRLGLENSDVPLRVRVRLLKCDREVLPGYTVRVQFDRFQEGERRIHLDHDMWVLEARTVADGEGVRVVELDCSTVDLQETTEARWLVELDRRQKAMRRHA